MEITVFLGDLVPSCFIEFIPKVSVLSAETEAWKDKRSQVYDGQM
jgi:hypothetical protein